MQRATPADYDRIRAFYQYVIATTPTMRTCCRWEYGKHPTDALILRYVTAGDMYYCEKDAKIVGVIAVTKMQEGDYCTVPWQEKFADDAVAVGHILCVDPQCAR